MIYVGQLGNNHFSDLFIFKPILYLVMEKGNKVYFDNWLVDK